MWTHQCLALPFFDSLLVQFWVGVPVPLHGCCGLLGKHGCTLMALIESEGVAHAVRAPCTVCVGWFTRALLGAHCWLPRARVRYSGVLGSVKRDPTRLCMRLSP